MPDDNVWYNEPLFQYLISIHLFVVVLFMVKSGCLSNSLAGGRSSLFTSRQRSNRSRTAGERLSGIGGGSMHDAIWNIWEQTLKHKPEFPPKICKNVLCQTWNKFPWHFRHSARIFCFDKRNNCKIFQMKIMTFWRNKVSWPLYFSRFPKLCRPVETLQTTYIIIIKYRISIYVFGDIRTHAEKAALKCKCHIHLPTCSWFTSLWLLRNNTSSICIIYIFAA